MLDNVTTGRDAPFTWKSQRWLVDAPSLSWRRVDGVVTAIELAPVVDVDDGLAVYAAATVTAIDAARRRLTAPAGVAAPRGGGTGDAWLRMTGGRVERVRVQSVVGETITLAEPLRVAETITAEAPAWIQWATYTGALAADAELSVQGLATWSVLFEHLDGQDEHRGTTRVEFRFDPGLTSAELLDTARHLAGAEDRRSDLAGPIEHARLHLVQKLRERFRPRTESSVPNAPGFRQVQIAYVVWWLERDMDARRQLEKEADRAFDRVCAALDLDRDLDGVPEPPRAVEGKGDFRARVPGMTTRVRGVRQ